MTSVGNLFSSGSVKQDIAYMCVSFCIYQNINNGQIWVKGTWMIILFWQLLYRYNFFFNREIGNIEKLKFLSMKKNFRLCQLHAVCRFHSKPELLSFQVSDLEGHCQLAGG